MNAYRSVLSAAGSAAIRGASRWLDASALLGPSPASPAVSATPTAARAAPARQAVNRPAPSLLISVLQSWIGLTTGLRDGPRRGWPAVYLTSSGHPCGRRLRIPVSDRFPAGGHGP